MLTIKSSVSAKIFFKPQQLSFSITTVLAAIMSSQVFAEDVTLENKQKLETIVIQAQGNWLENANAEKVHNHAGARTIVDRQRMDETATTSIRDA